MSDVELAASGKRVAFVADEHSKRRLIVLLPDGQELPGQLAGRAGGAAGGGSRGSNQPFVGELGLLLLGRLLLSEWSHLIRLGLDTRVCSSPRAAVPLHVGSGQVGGRSAACPPHRRANRHLVRTGLGAGHASPALHQGVHPGL